MEYDILIVTTIPAFYKVNLFNHVAQRKKILVLYTGSKTGKRSNDFMSESLAYDHRYLDGGIKSIFETFNIIRLNKFKKVVVSGWDNIISFVIASLSKKQKNVCLVESSVCESNTTGWKAFPKTILLKRMGKVLASGESQEALVRALNYKGEIVKFGGCGILNYVEQPPYEPRSAVRKFLYVGQLIDVKNVGFIIKYFNNHPEYNLTVIGTGILREQLEKEAHENIVFLGAVNNKELPKYYRDADVFVLPSKSESWGLVVEEALNNGTPVLVSSKVGCASTLVVPNKVGCVFESITMESFDKCVNKIVSVEYYNELRRNASELDFFARANYQVKCFCES